MQALYSNVVHFVIFLMLQELHILCSQGTPVVLNLGLIKIQALGGLVMNLRM